jgi:hypothetical protein
MPFNNAEIIYQYTRAQAIEDGVLVDLNALFPDEVRDAGILFPIVITDTAFAKYIDLTPAAVKMCNDLKGRAWDVLWMFANGARQNRNGSAFIYKFYCVVDKPKAQLCQLKAMVHGGDNGEPVITLMETWED